MNTPACPAIELKSGLDRIFYIAKKVLEIGVLQDKLLDDVQTCVRKTQHGYQLTVNFKPWNRSEYLSVAHDYMDNDLFGYSSNQSFFANAEDHARHLVEIILADAFAIAGGWRY